MTMTDTSDKPLQKALEILEVAALTHDDFTASDTCAAAFAFVKEHIEADEKVIEAAEVIAHKPLLYQKDWDDLDAALAAREQVKIK